MADINNTLDALFSSPELSALLGGDDDAPTEPPSEPALPDLSQILKLLPLLSTLGKEDDNAALLKALRPHLSGERQKKLDEAGQWLKIAKLLPLIKELKGDDSHDA